MREAAARTERQAKPVSKTTRTALSRTIVASKEAAKRPNGTAFGSFLGAAP